MIEEWKNVVGFEGLYEVSNLGQIRTVGRHVPYERWGAGKTRWVKPKIRKVTICRTHGYRYINAIRSDGVRMNIKIHLAVLLAFVGPRPIGMQGCHDDSDKSNNRLDNLRWDTPAGNNADKGTHGTDPAGERNPAAVLTEVQVREIRARTGGTLKAIGAEFGVSYATIHDIRAGKSWAHIS